MGWFWSDVSAATAIPPASHRTPDTSPPPGCPMHKPTESPPAPPSACPVKHDVSSPPPIQSSTLSKLNPLNYMPQLSQSRAANQSQILPTTREPSTIPRGDANSNWEYPSPQQMYNAMLRKGGGEVPIDAVESMVAVHNFLNEGAWAEIVNWERRFSRGLGEGWKYCREGEERFEDIAAAREEGREIEPRLIRFQGRPREMTPKARILQALGQVWPSKFGSEPPFDRHDWYVQRTTEDGSRKEVRYVIDYYSAPPEPTGEPVFYLDVRPAVDTPSAAAARLMRWSGDVWYRASGAEARTALGSLSPRT